MSQEKYRYAELNQQQFQRRRIPIKAFTNPSYAMSFPIVLTKFRSFHLLNGIGAYVSMLFIISKTINQIQQFRYRIKNGRMVCYQQIDAGIVLLKERKMMFATLDQSQKFNDFSNQYDSIKNKDILNVYQRQDVFYTSCSPWVPFQSAVGPFGPADDLIPRVLWGKIVENNGKFQTTFSLMLNHHAVDGVHIGQFYQKLQYNFDNPQKTII